MPWVGISAYFFSTIMMVMMAGGGEGPHPPTYVAGSPTSFCRAYKVLILLLIHLSLAKLARGRFDETAC